MATRYIIVLFLGGIFYTLLTDNKFHIFVGKNAKAYKRPSCAIKAAIKIIDRYFIDQIYVLKVEPNEELNCKKYDSWCNDENRKMWMFSY